MKGLEDHKKTGKTCMRLQAIRRQEQLVIMILSVEVETSVLGPTVAPTRPATDWFSRNT